MILVKKRSIKLNKEDEIILDILKKRRRRLPSKQIYKTYKNESKTSLGFNAFKNRLSRLCSKGLIRPVGEKRWRTYEYFMVDLENNEIDEHLPEWAKSLKEAYLRCLRALSQK